MRTEVEGLATALEAFLTEEVEVAKNSHQVHRKEGPPIWSDEIWRESDPDGFERAQNARSALAAYRACEAVTVEGLDLDALEKVARGVASIGSWRCGPNMLNGGLTVNDAVGSIADILSDGPGEYIATFDPPTVLRLFAALRAQADRVRVLEGALEKVNAIRNSIIGCQRVNFSEHVYPLVAALNEAGFTGQDYAEARENVGTMLERTLAAEARAEAAERRAGEIAESKAAKRLLTILQHAEKNFPGSADARFYAYGFTFGDLRAFAALLPATQAEGEK